jgi:hypothetical protein
MFIALVDNDPGSSSSPRRGFDRVVNDGELVERRFEHGS